MCSNLFSVLHLSNLMFESISPNAHGVLFASLAAGPAVRKPRSAGENDGNKKALRRQAVEPLDVLVKCQIETENREKSRKIEAGM